jgi:hypothetical protein
MLLLLYCLPLLFTVIQKSGLCCCCYIVYHYCLMFDRAVVDVVVGYIVYHYCFKVWQWNGSCCFYIVYNYCLRFYRGVVHVVVVILSTITVLGLTEEWFMLLVYCLPLLFTIWQRSDSCCCCYIFNYYCFRFDRGVVDVVVIFVYHYCLRFYRGGAHILVVILSTITV